jgi:hypothetical protein
MTIGLHAVGWAFVLVLAWLCLRQAWRLGRGGFDEHGNIRDPVGYLWVRFWGVPGLSLISLVLIDLLNFVDLELPSQR